MAREGIVYVDADLLDAAGLEALANLPEFGLRAVRVGDRATAAETGGVESSELPPIPAPGSWYLAARPPEARLGFAAGRLIVIGPTAAATRRQSVAPRTARDVRTAVLEVIAEHLNG